MNQHFELTSRSVPVALDQICRRIFVAVNRAATHRAIALVFGEDPEDWNAYVNGGRSYQVTHIQTWLWYWRKAGLPNIAIREFEPGRFKAETTDEDTAFHKFKEPLVAPQGPRAHPRGLELLGSGSSRTVYRFDEDTVVKIPRNIQGEQVNAIEARMYADEIARLERNGIPATDCGLARCWLGKLDDGDEDEVLFMEFVKKCRTDHAKHRKHLRHVDRGQVGHNKAGRLVKFDYGG